MVENSLPKIAILLATYNGASWLSEQLSSILASKGVDLTIFVSDDGSTDDTLALIQEYASDRITILPPVKTGGAG